MTKPRAYIASPLGFTEAGRYYYQHVLLPALADIVEIVDPWSLATDAEFAAAAAAGQERALALDIAARNRAAIDSADIIIAVLDGQEPDAGTVSEVGYAVGQGMSAWGLRTDHRHAGEAGVVINLQVEGFIEQSGGAIASSLDELLSILPA